MDPVLESSLIKSEQNVNSKFKTSVVSDGG
jgi:hypothetical protein